jgi:flagellar motility protein MotE (MotC chaperone)
MKKYLLYGLAGTMLFAGSATLSLWMQQQARPKAETEAADQAAAHPAGKAREKEKETGKAAHDAAKADSGEDLRAAVRPSGPPSAEDTLRMVNSLRDKQRNLREREEQLTARQKQLETIYQDIRGERNVLDELRKQVADEMKALNEKMVSVDRRAGDVDQKDQAFAKRVSEQKKSQTEIDNVELKNIDKISEMYNSMAPDAAARILQQMADSGQMNTAVKILSKMKERQAAKVLAELPDATLAAQLLEKMRGVKRPTPAQAASLPVTPTSATPPPGTEVPR